MGRTVFRNCILLDVDHTDLHRRHDVLVVDNLIREISGQPIEAADALVIDAAGRTLMPGLIDAHVHVTAAEIDLANDHIPTSEVSIQAAHFMEDMLQRGFTTVRDAGGADSGLANAVAKGLIKGPRLFYSGKALSQTGGHGDFRKRNHGIEPCGCSGSATTIAVICDGVDEARKAVREQLRQGATQIKIMASGGVASPTDRVANVQFSIEEIRAIVEEAADGGTYVMAHAYTPKAVERCVANGVRTIEHGNLIDEKAASVMAANGAFLVPTLVVYQSLAALGPEEGFPPESLDKLRNVIEAGRNAIRLARQHGVKIGLGTDLLGIAGMKWQSREFELRAEVDQPIDIIASATVVNAEILNQVGKLGVVAPGAYADLLLVDGNPLVDIRLLLDPAKNLALIMKDGTIHKNRL